VRVIAGTARGRILKTPANDRIRPTADRIKEALFSAIISRSGSLTGMSVLDICAGTGNLGIEALSRGAEHVTFIDNDHAATDLIKANVQNLGFQNHVTVLEMTANRALPYLQVKNEQPFDLVFFDPPYKLTIPPDVLLQLSNSGLLTAAAIVVVEQDRRSELADTYGILSKFNRRVYGDTALFFYSPAPEYNSAVSDETINA
jgi:16S rRNA (guanine(966)-N(2))-methyltransferase RsmD